MRYIVLVAALLVASGCEENNYYYGFSDAGAVVLCDGASSECEMSGVWTSDSKIQGHGTLTIQAAPAAPAPTLPWPLIQDTTEMQGSQTFLDLRTADGMPHVATITLGLTQPPPPQVLGAVWSEAVAVLNWGVGGIPLRVEIDFIAGGTTFSIPVSQLQLHAVYRAVPNTGPIGIPPQTLTVGASVATGVIAHGRQPQRTLTKGNNIFAGPTPALIPGQFETWYVPQFAKSFRVVAFPNNSQMQFSLASLISGTPSAVYNTVAYPSADLPVTNGAFLVIVQNTGLANVQAYSMIFELNL